MTTSETGQRSPRFVTVADACVQLGIGKVKFYELMNAGEFGEVIKLPPHTKQAGTRIEQSGIDAFIERNRQRS